ncbi:MAG TPA: hemolysin family protein [Opitutales bacterium]|nr:hemolysin family protein [Opitutales bacterium]
MNTDWTQLTLALALMLALIVLHGALVACEFSLVKLRYSLVDSTALAAARQQRRVARVIDDADQVARGIRFGLRFCATVIGADAIVVIHATFGHWPGLTGATAEWWLGALILFGVVVMLYLVGDTIARGVALARPFPTLHATCGLALAFTFLSLPVRRGMRSISQGVFRRFGVETRQDFNLLDVEVQMRALGEDEEVLPPFLRGILANTLRTRDFKLADVLVPRHQIISINLQGEVAASLEAARQSGHTRFPLCDGDLDHCIGLIHIKDLYRHDADLPDLRTIKRDILRLPQTEPLPAALEKLLRQKMHMALVVGEFGGVTGLVTLERLIEEVVGDIQDEFDSTEENPIKALPDGRGYRVLGLAPLRDVEQTLGVIIPNTQIATFGGLITAELGRIPAAGEHVVLPQPGLEVVIDEADARRVISATVRRIA